MTGEAALRAFVEDLERLLVTSPYKETPATRWFMTGVQAYLAGEVDTLDEALELDHP